MAYYIDLEKISIDQYKGILKSADLWTSKRDNTLHSKLPDN